jgi:hypothetical protein
LWSVTLVTSALVITAPVNDASCHVQRGGEQAEPYPRHYKERRVRNNPRSWRLRQELGFFHYIFLRDPRRASAILSEAADLPGAAFWLRTLSADILQKGGERAAARRMWLQMYEQAEEGIIRENARVRLQSIDSADLADRLSGAVEEFARRFGRRPARLADLRDAGLWNGPLADLAQVPFSYDVGTGRVTISESSPIRRLE